MGKNEKKIKLKENWKMSSSFAIMVPDSDDPVAIFKIDAKDSTEARSAIVKYIASDLRLFEMFYDLCMQEEGSFSYLQSDCPEDIETIESREDYLEDVGLFQVTEALPTFTI